MSHPNCTRPTGHVCQKPSGRACIEHGCTEPAGTLWGPIWCPEHDADRLDRVSAQMEALLDGVIWSYADPNVTPSDSEDEDDD